MLHIKDKGLFNIKVLSLEYVKLKIQHQNQDIYLSTQFKNAAYSYEIMTRVADIDECFDKIQTSFCLMTLKDIVFYHHDILRKCYLLVGAAINIDPVVLNSNLAENLIQESLVNLPVDISQKLKKVESVSLNCKHQLIARYQALHKASKLTAKGINSADNDYLNALENLHISVSELQLSLNDIFTQKLSRTH